MPIMAHYPAQVASTVEADAAFRTYAQELFQSAEGCQHVIYSIEYRRTIKRPPEFGILFFKTDKQFENYVARARLQGASRIGALHR